MGVMAPEAPATPAVRPEATHRDQTPDNLFARLHQQSSSGELEDAVSANVPTVEMNPTISPEFLELYAQVQRAIDPVLLPEGVHATFRLISVTPYPSGVVGLAETVREALAALSEGTPRLLHLAPPGQLPPEREGLVVSPMTCASEGSLEVFVEPRLPAPHHRRGSLHPSLRRHRPCRHAPLDLPGVRGSKHSPAPSS